MIKYPDKEFNRTSGSMKGARFRRQYSNKNAIMYKVDMYSDDGEYCYTTYEVFKKVISRSKYNTSKVTHYKYPREEDFGEWAWCYKSDSRALVKMTQLV